MKKLLLLQLFLLIFSAFSQEYKITFLKNIKLEVATNFSGKKEWEYCFNKSCPNFITAYFETPYCRLWDYTDSDVTSRSIPLNTAYTDRNFFSDDSNNEILFVLIDGSRTLRCYNLVDNNIESFKKALDGFVKIE